MPNPKMVKGRQIVYFVTSSVSNSKYFTTSKEPNLILPNMWPGNDWDFCLAKDLKWPELGKSNTREGSASLEQLEKPVWRPKGRQLNKFRIYAICVIRY